MSPTLLSRITVREGCAAVGPRGAEPEDVAGRLEAGETPEGVASSLGLEPADLLAAIAYLGLGPDGLEGPELTQQPPARPALGGSLTESTLAQLLPQASRPARLNVAAGLLQALDFWDASHEAAQRADDLGERSTSAYWHGIAHRREPDPGNAAYWFRRVGRHPAFSGLERAARPLLDGDPMLAARLLRGGSWDPFAFIDACTSARSGSSALLRRLQRCEMAVLLDESARLAGAIA